MKTRTFISPWRVIAVSSVIVSLIIGGIPSSKGQGKPDPGAADLKRLFEELQAAMTANDEAKAGKITQALFPDKVRVQKALSDTANPEMVQKIVDFQSKLPTDPAKVARFFKMTREQTNVNVYGATTGELEKNAKDSVAYHKFPGGARKLAELGILRPGVTFYEVEFVEPGKDGGMVYHLFFWDGNAWTMFGPMWRAVQQ